MNGKTLGTYRHHMSPSELLGELGESTFFSYHKIANIRNPWDKVTSLFFWKLRHLNLGPQKLSIEMMDDFVSNHQLQRKVDMEVTESRYQVQSLIRYENLNEDLLKVMEHLQIPNKHPLRRFKSEFRPETSSNYQRYFSSAARDRIATLYEGWIKEGNYTF